MTRDKSIRALWSAVILAAMEDYKKGVRGAARFIDSDDLDAVSDIVEINADKIRAKMQGQG